MIYASTATAAAAATAEFLRWCVEHGVDELYLYPAQIRGCPLPSNATTEAALSSSVRTADQAGVSVQLFVGPNKEWATKLDSCVRATVEFTRGNNLHPRRVNGD